MRKNSRTQHKREYRYKYANEHLYQRAIQRKILPRWIPRDIADRYFKGLAERAESIVASDGLIKKTFNGITIYERCGYGKTVIKARKVFR